MTRARLRGFKQSIPNGVLYLLRSAKDKSLSGRVFFNIMFRDVTFQKYDFAGELASLRNGITLVNQEFVITKLPSIDVFLSSVIAKPENQKNWDLLRELFNQYGSDKSTKNNLHELYGPLLDTFKDASEVKVLEIGLGTNNVDVPSNMGTSGKPGASLYAFNAYLGTKGKIFGADIDRNILFEAENIKTFYVNQLHIESLIDLGKISEGFDLIIDDGLHIFEANINTFTALMPRLKSKGIFVIEDISSLPENLFLWQVVSEKLNLQGIVSSLVKSSTSIVFVAIKN